MSATDEGSQSNTPPTDRSAWRDTYIYASGSRDTILGGLWASEGITNANLNSCRRFSVSSPIRSIYMRTANSWLGGMGNSFNQAITLLSLICYRCLSLTRSTSLPSGTRVESFRDAVLQRDQRYVVTGMHAVLAHVGRWRGFEAAHIFPWHTREWSDCNYSRLITIPPTNNESHGSTDSVQNGILLMSNMQQFFDSYDLAINPDDNYKIVCFTPDLTHYHVAGRHLDQSFIDNPLRPVDAFLRWHFRRTVLANMKGAGEPSFETDFPAGLDMMGEIQRGPKSAERMEFELCSHFNAMGDHS
ncbi:hypothetical protein HOY80DRAFT_1137745 [Tuber brumale]|nr:hypothetical protein HOY80DRAFT_1137745 [Tuber brumale]